jgi:hypothetical protein
MQAALADTQTKAYLNSVADNPQWRDFLIHASKKLYCCPTCKTRSNGRQQRNGNGNKARTANNIFAPGGVDVWFKVLLSLFHLVLGTGRSFKFPPDRKYLRCVPGS